jgi:fumarate hydratase, class I
MADVSAEAVGEVAKELLLRASTRYPLGFFARLMDSYGKEGDATARSVLVSIVDNILMASEYGRSICQDTGVPTFHLFVNPDVRIEGDMERALAAAVVESTERVPLRKNVIEPFSLTNSGNNTGWGVPVIHYHRDPRVNGLKIRAELKGFGGEIKSTYDWIFTSAKSMENVVLAYVLNSVLLSKGEACLPSFIGVGVGGYGADAALNAKNAVFKGLNRTSGWPSGERNRFISELERRLCRCINKLGLGPMGMGGMTTTLGTYVSKCGTQTAAAPVAVDHQCWANRASEAVIRDRDVKFLTRHVERTDVARIRRKIAEDLGLPQARCHELTLPLETDTLTRLKVGDIVYLTGTVFTARDMAHRKLVDLLRAKKRDEIPKEILRSRAVFHCGPIAQRVSGKWVVKSAGPTTSSRFTQDGTYLVEEGVTDVIIGKGTMGAKMVDAMKGKAVYLKATGGCAVCYGNAIQNTNVKWLELGYPEAVWVFDMKRFGPLIVGIDSKGNSLTSKVMESVYENAHRVYVEEGLESDVRYLQNPLTLAGLSLDEVIELCRS